MIVATTSPSWAGPDGPPDDSPAPPGIPPGRRPAGVVALPDGGVARHVLVVEKSTQSLLVYEAGPRGPVLERRLPCTTGKVAGDKQREGDLKTPEGVYWFLSHVDGEELPPLYGAGALTMDFPNEFDRLDGKTGSGIWLHGVETNDRVYHARDTRGCVAVRNDDFDELLRLIDMRDTPILIVDVLETRDVATLAADAERVAGWLEEWRSAWETKDLESYGAKYAPGFRSEGRDRSAWLAHKRELASRYESIRVELGEPTILREKDRLWLRFQQLYASDGHADAGVKTLSLLPDAAEAGGWSILAEEWSPAGREVPRLAELARLTRARPSAASPLRPPALEAATAPGPVAVVARAEPAPAGEEKAATAPGPVAVVARAEPTSKSAGSAEPTPGTEVKAAPPPPDEKRGPSPVPPDDSKPGATDAPSAAEPAALAAPLADDTRKQPAPETVEARPARTEQEPAAGDAAPGAIAVVAAGDGPHDEAAALTAPEALSSGPSEPEERAAPPAAALTRAPVAHLDAPRASRGTFSLLAPFARLQAGDVLVDVQLLNGNPSLTRDGEAELRPPDGPPRVTKFRVRQGELLTVKVAPASLADGVARVAVVIRDAGGRVLLDQDVVLSAS